MKRVQLTPGLWNYCDQEQTTVTVVIAPFGGGSAYSMTDWVQQLLAGSYRVLVLQYPGRGSRSIEPLPVCIRDLAATAAKDVLLYTQDPLLLIGHSMGALLCHELALLLEQANRTVEYLVLSAARPPHLNGMVPEEILRMSREAWIEELKTNIGNEDKKLLHEDVIDLMLPVLRADYLLVAEHKQASGKVHCPILAIGGDRDPWVSPYHLQEWQSLTHDSFQLVMFPGDHFYYRDQLYDIYLCIHQACLKKEVCTNE
ncbi:MULTISPECIES: thioesterase II family protein [Photorhabdus]|uniref:thioesterase II family protein n=1 Tax=Photorhabdus TaxID=29487 RepID=UPI000DCC3506|nr:MULTISPECIES: alpha/beta fold hydrolase [Photorhabdus]MCT8344409.1 alpha/beta fold hydrolase [Photorhabdus kleinii]RAW93911.1 thioesterase [Photorhabdus sp. S9-53]RAW93982.1 thioesterase [Photorhabdus sp. S10-54]RAW97443.1 thioesterase [Photorhabdus sp. S8-52]